MVKEKPERLRSSGSRQRRRRFVCAPAPEPTPTAAEPCCIEARAESALTYSDDRAVPANLLDGDEVVILAVKPSSWFVAIRSVPWLVGVALLWWLAQSSDRFAFSTQLGVAVALAFVCINGIQWATRLYVLTNRRILRIRGSVRVDMAQTLLTHVSDVNLSIAVYERPLGLGTIHIHTPDTAEGLITWLHVARAEEVHRTILEAIRRIKNQNSARNL